MKAQILSFQDEFYAVRGEFLGEALRKVEIEICETGVFVDITRQVQHELGLTFGKYDDELTESQTKLLDQVKKWRQRALSIDESHDEWTVDHMWSSEQDKCKQDIEDAV